MGEKEQLTVIPNASHTIAKTLNVSSNILSLISLNLITQGATIKADESSGRILIARVMHGGAADRSGLISVGDEVIEVNGINVEGKTPNDVLKILVSSKASFHLLYLQISDLSNNHVEKKSSRIITRK